MRPGTIGYTLTLPLRHLVGNGPPTFTINGATGRANPVPSVSLVSYRDPDPTGNIEATWLERDFFWSTIGRSAELMETFLGLIVLSGRGLTPSAASALGKF